MAYPVIDLPMYEPLKRSLDELFLPNLNLIEQNSITLLETNQKFIEAYMVGLNHEFARELLWREYPTDQRGSCFRQFWDVRGMLDPAEPDPEALREKLRDIPQLHHWPRARRSATTTTASRAGDNEQEVVLVIRGELLKKYPTAVIYAQQGALAARRTATIDPSQERLLVDAHGGRGGQPAARQAADAAVRGEGRSRHHVLRLRPHRRRGARRQRRAPDDDRPAGSS